MRRHIGYLEGNSKDNSLLNLRQIIFRKNIESAKHTREIRDRIRLTRTSIFSRESLEEEEEEDFLCVAFTHRYMDDEDDDDDRGMTISSLWVFFSFFNALQGGSIRGFFVSIASSNTVNTGQLRLITVN